MCSCYTLPPFSRHRPLSEPIDCAQHPSSPFPLTLSLAPAMLCVQILDLKEKIFQTLRVRLTLLLELHGCFSHASGVPPLM